VLNIVKGDTIEFEKTPPVKYFSQNSIDPNSQIFGPNFIKNFNFLHFVLTIITLFYIKRVLK